ncbi:hypothetical protein Ahy_A05g022448 isoform B [Arachis hypogaea]|uniref:Uncharacterized protein n=1 Tax=Arachis hypogaea TaxID=3818 RepID=A0A445D0Q7_ARAHY|nr:hypothetical protein Ahy_A05g022448 isoform B [Arachis hypogaea]
MAMLIGDKISRYILTSRKCMRSRLRQSSICRGYRINTRQKGKLRTSEHLDGTIAMVEAYTSRNMRTLY